MENFTTHGLPFEAINYVLLCNVSSDKLATHFSGFKTALDSDELLIHTWFKVKNSKKAILQV